VSSIAEVAEGRVSRRLLVTGTGRPAAPQARVGCRREEESDRHSDSAGVLILPLSFAIIFQPGIREQIVHEIQQVFEGKVIWGADLMKLTLHGSGVARIESRGLIE
jgi:hypothetical protein